MPRIEVATELDTITCNEPGCGILFGVPIEWMAGRRRDHKPWSCPNNHQRMFTGKSREEELKDELKRANETVTYLRTETHRLSDKAARLKRQHAAQKGVATRLRNKAIAGECAFCGHQFPDVAEHVKAEHPSEVAETAAEGDDAD